MSVLDPSKDKLAYFKDNIQTAEDQEDFDASQYYYNRQDGFFKSGQPGLSGADGASQGGGLSMPPGSFGSFGGSSGQTGMNSFLAATTTGLGMGSIGMGSMGMSGGMGMGLGMSSNTTSQRSSPAPSSNGGLPPHEMNYMARTLSSDSTHASKPRASFPEKGPDMSEFPALTSRSMSLDPEPSSSSTRQNSEFVIQKEDFPALSAFGSSDRSAQSSSNDVSMSSSNDALLQRHQPTNVNNTSIGSRAGGSLNNYASSGNFQSNNLNAFPTLGEAKHATGQDRQNNNSDEQSKFSLLGMLQFMRPHESERTLVHGYDLTSLGMNLNSSESLHQTFASPWADAPCTKEPQYNLPTCYYNQPPVLKTTHLSKFQLETLFFIFYAMPKDVVQAYAAQELYIREWRYHMELKLWFKRQASDGPVQYIYFDINSWERRLFGGNSSGVSAGFMGEEEIRVKFNPTA
ncbi:unnamed protein product [Aphanomyces euteiches]|uniref:NOT2/NOT3/NOT5 C-terminal domain-containing protein n=1 Tax=Aphanomyces euteiches TaxID=100861 RepID=A0A6G0XKF6_9STRA|nr:hypothetical protein Ae201684_003770 [Aphanomyces euteiches]KAH9084824.1 hypothetical protein Ae201684P_002063 [Aphanomyces euteiches]